MESHVGFWVSGEFDLKSLLEVICSIQQMEQQW